MKRILFVTLSLVLANVAFAKGGVKSPQEMAIRNSPAGFAHESLEHATEILNFNNPNAINQVISASIQILSESSSLVVIQLNDGSTASFDCSLVQDFSKGGSVVKNEARCFATEVL